MKLLLDENLSRRLIPFLQHDYPCSSQVVLLGLEAASDSVVWYTAKDHGFVIVTRDADFEELSLVWGQPPKVIWLKTRNQSRAATLKILLDNRTMIEDALVNRGQACVELSDSSWSGSN
jgi:predicted nuclease of predicted toxin-antitoxin system